MSDLKFYRRREVTFLYIAMEAAIYPGYRGRKSHIIMD